MKLNSLRKMAFIAILLVLLGRFAFRQEQRGGAQARLAPLSKRVEERLAKPVKATGQQKFDGATRYEWQVAGAEGVNRVRIYIPDAPIRKPVPIVLVAPAGSNCITGNQLEGDYTAEYLPYAQAGFAVVSYSVSGEMPENASDREVLHAMQVFRKAEGGVADAMVSLNMALKKHPQLDEKSVFTAGHSSAGTISLGVAAYEPRIKGCIAYAPATDLIGRLGRRGQAIIANVEGEEDFLNRVSPVHLVKKIKCPVYLFGAEDDGNVPFEETQRFAKSLAESNKGVTFESASSGGHYDSMIRAGIPNGIKWLKKILK